MDGRGTCRRSSRLLEACQWIGGRMEWHVFKPFESVQAYFDLNKSFPNSFQAQPGSSSARDDHKSQSSSIHLTCNRFILAKNERKKPSITINGSNGFLLLDHLITMMVLFDGYIVRRCSTVYICHAARQQQRESIQFRVQIGVSTKGEEEAGKHKKNGMKKYRKQTRIKCFMFPFRTHQMGREQKQSSK